MASDKFIDKVILPDGREYGFPGGTYEAIAGAGMRRDAFGRVQVEGPLDLKDAVNLEYLGRYQIGIVLTANTTWYVDATNGNDSYTIEQIPSKGQTPATAFKDLQAACNFVSAYFDLGSYQGTINLLSDVSVIANNNTLLLPSYRTGTGLMYIRATAIKRTVTCFIRNGSGNTYNFSNLLIKAPSQGYPTAGYARLITCNSLSSTVFLGCDFDLTDADASLLNIFFCVHAGGLIYTYGPEAPADAAVPSQLRGKFDYVFELVSNGTVQFGSNVNFNLVTNSARAGAKRILSCLNMSNWLRTVNRTGLSSYSTVTGSITVQGADVLRRIVAEGNSIVNTVGGGGDALFPWGTIQAPTNGGQIF